VLLLHTALFIFYFICWMLENLTQLETVSGYAPPLESLLETPPHLLSVDFVSDRKRVLSIVLLNR
jgi:hypothetical protein